MEDTARLALIEMFVSNDKQYENILNEMLQLINHILANPFDRDFCRLRSRVLQGLLKCNDFREYLLYLGFELDAVTNDYVFTGQIEKLNLARIAIEKKIVFCFGPEKYMQAQSIPLYRKKLRQLKSAEILNTTNPFLLSIQTMFNEMLKYEDEALQEYGRSHIPLMCLQLRAFERMRAHQKKIKTGEIKDDDMSYDMALLAELVGWFKHEFFLWVDKPACDQCAGATTFVRKTNGVIDGESCVIEEYKCTSCEPGVVTFPRHNEVRALLRTRRGRCGEYANCFALLARSLGYDTRYVFDTADHVWCEVFDYDTNGWIHVDPCEGKMNSPLMYAHGWKKKLSYVIAVSRDDLQDVTWRYTTNHKEVLTRRNRCTEGELLDSMLALREHRQAQVSQPRRRYLAKRALLELVELLHERSPQDYEAQGRLSGSLEWRKGRGEIGHSGKGHVFEFDQPGDYTIKYCTSTDEYTVSRDGEQIDKVSTWASGLFACKHMFRKVEHDWKQVYLAREEGEKTGLVGWKMAVKSDDQRLAFQSLSITAVTQVYETGKIDWTLQFDGPDSKIVTLCKMPLTEMRRRFTHVVVGASLSGGAGASAWQHAQLFRQPASSADVALELRLALRRDPDPAVLLDELRQQREGEE
ncbi:peptide-N(4)-(N-acetyl-beta-glucosaminyl)asparagine amidase [Epargyreus clarus]|uniref:peptide-N(4)-(N-acetyl-beta- glucosaminyl)asparagine amidase n=1 Tax=Epargyreus clarus TaxID=520877 RepID=UPI003C2D189B